MSTYMERGLNLVEHVPATFYVNVEIQIKCKIPIRYDTVESRWCL